jgi:CelD/BcsL family acetyltransferase involved in cellulose biosynthesis
MPTQAFQVTSPAPRAVWQDLINSDPEAIPYQTPAWLDCICAAGRYADASRLYESPEGKQLVLPMVRTKGLPALLTTEATLPHAWGIGGLVSADAINADDVAAVMTDLAGRTVLRTSIRPNPRAGETWAAARPEGVIAIPRLAHVLDLDGGFDQVWSKGFTKNTRNRIRKAERSKLVVECDTTGKFVPVFYDLMQRSFDRWARQQHEPLALARWRARRRDPLRKFQIIARTLGDACRIYVAWLDGQPAATMLVLQDANVNDAWGAMDKDLAAPHCANDLLQRLTIEDACRAGCRYYHMGESGTSVGLAHYKSRFGARPYAYAEYRLERFPITRVDGWLRGLVKKLIGFKDA